MCENKQNSLDLSSEGGNKTSQVDLLVMPQGGYNIIYSDPPWNFGNRMYSSNGQDQHREIGRAYDVMNTKEICELPIRQIAGEDCVLFMWTTDAHIPDAIEVMKKWGFKYKTVAFIWLKKEMSGTQVCYMGQWTMKNAELVLLGTKGKMTKYLKSRKVRQLVEAKRNREKHSQKPQEVKNRIIQMFGNELPKIELFARGDKEWRNLFNENRFDGWHTWGNEIESDINLAV